MYDDVLEERLCATEVPSRTTSYECMPDSLSVAPDQVRVTVFVPTFEKMIELGGVGGVVSAGSEDS